MFGKPETIKEQIKLEIKKREEQLVGSVDIKSGEIFIDTERQEVMIMIDCETLIDVCNIREESSSNCYAVSLTRGGEPVRYSNIDENKKLFKKVRHANIVIEEE